MSLSTLAPVDAVWASSKFIPIPTADILTFAFANLGRYDQNAPIFVDARSPSDSVSALHAYRIVHQLIRGFKELGLKEGDCVCLHSYNNIWYPLLWLAIIGAGGCVSGTNPGYSSSELVGHFNLTKPKYILSEVACIKPIIDAASQCNIATSNIFFVGTQDIPHVHGCRSWRTLLIDCECDWSASNQHDAHSAPNRVAVYAMTSGTTGLPKVAMISHRYVVAQTVFLESQFDARPYQPSQLICLPVFHAFASPLALVLPLRRGIPTYFLPRFTLQGFLHAVGAFSITDTPVVPPIIASLNQSPESDHHLLRSLRYVICAGAPMTTRVQTKLYDILDAHAVISQCWGTTEGGWHTLFDWQEKDTSGSVGRLMPNVQMKVIDDDGNPVGEDDKLGEALIRSPIMFSGYLDNPDANKEAFDVDGFYRTGDRVYVQNNKIFHEGRIKEVMKVNGWQVSPTELETVLMEHPLISDAAVVGMTRENQLGIQVTLPCAYVVRVHVESVGQGSGTSNTDVRGGLEPLTAKEVTDFIASKLISYKHLTGGVVFVKEIPRSSTGKIMRRLLSATELDSSN
ncbi:uncharacterized protein Z518_11187 [Rhinocladiella mackenziei CBS 650.93]|uniref:Rhinocladiella mackenziei CBS 650.93 unplaced genomic scaffold supercont1.12, whole genome shotgun sequence n=1 Tax=Rhinocladiella mackenziei CBS 650.93 TaxID=1442369 RepID=A0A0D2I170_9EURO|nr:uncharacterized protein Z518_11187 [Rhinocladiella mackenziei CBS 650.93]KIW99448.1 hypothetical protein Z518_11187 [Rhinocladiella mackenziei CBS 650.93]